MLIVAIALIGALAVAGLIAFVVLCLGIRREDKAASLDRQAPGFAALQARRFTGWREASPEPRSTRGHPSLRRVKEVSR